MHLFSSAFLARHQAKLLFVVIWLHVSVLDLFFVTYSGPVFLWQDNTQVLTLVVHLIIAFAVTALYQIVSFIRKSKFKKLGEQL